MEISVSDIWKPTTIVILLGFLLMAVNSSIPMLFIEGSDFLPIIDFLVIIGFNILTVFWCFYDSAERGERLSSGFVLLMVILGIFGLLIYLFRSRGFKSGLVATFKLLLLFFTAAIVSTVIYIIINYLAFSL